jgi:flagellar protein FliL
MRRLRRLLPIVLIVGLVAGLGAAAFLILGSSNAKPFQIQVNLGNTPSASADSTPAPADAAADGSSVPQPSSPEVEGIIYELGDKIVNLAEPGGYRYLKVAMALEFLPSDSNYFALKGEALKQAQEKYMAKLTARRSVIDDSVTLTLSSKTFDQVFSLEGKEALKEELIRQINTKLGKDGQVGKIYFTQFIIQ